MNRRGIETDPSFDERAKEMARFLRAIRDPQTPEERVEARDYQVGLERARLEVGDRFGLSPIVHIIYEENKDFYETRPPRQIPQLGRGTRMS